MFEIGFSELLLVGIVALIIIGPERLPTAARWFVYWIGRLNRCYQNTKQVLAKEMDTDSVKLKLYNEEVMESMETTNQKNQPSQFEDVAVNSANIAGEVPPKPPI